MNADRELLKEAREGFQALLPLLPLSNRAAIVKALIARIDAALARPERVAVTDEPECARCRWTLRWQPSFRERSYVEDNTVAVRCADCGTVFCKRCIYEHFVAIKPDPVRDSPEAAVVSLRAANQELQSEIERLRKEAERDAARERAVAAESLCSESLEYLDRFVHNAILPTRRVLLLIEKLRPYAAPPVAPEAEAPASLPAEIKKCERCDGEGQVCAKCNEMCEDAHPNDPMGQCPDCHGTGAPPSEAPAIKVGDRVKAKEGATPCWAYMPSGLSREGEVVKIGSSCSPTEILVRHDLGEDEDPRWYWNPSDLILLPPSEAPAKVEAEQCAHGIALDDCGTCCASDAAPHDCEAVALRVVKAEREALRASLTQEMNANSNTAQASTLACIIIALARVEQNGSAAEKPPVSKSTK